ncbi:GNAT family N-acetyltransferase [Phreatobacter aquaticus]|uniref:GNAT family N-acetyltransferase n=1 Tax=Phreatobacter aquaticus TaxID=2570229 RepID=A0A4D7QDV3_9HYPH|nr:GNAT family N-acetyltransferase [Phreatobacter aquaticus]QCK84641.1 GNAT family N-acetyltransferase [Phreatobacter aquaticus]
MTQPLLDLDGHTDVPNDRVAAIVTYLQVLEKPLAGPRSDAVRLVPVPKPDLGWYRDLYRAIGGDWLWTSRLRLSDDALAAILHHPDVAVFSGEGAAGSVGIVELDFRVPGEAEIVFFGLRPEATGKSLGAAMMARAVDEAWRPGIGRVWLHTCTLDHPAAVKFYQRQGFRPYKRAIEIFPDPRLTGIFPRSAAAHVPVIGS